MCKKTIFSLFMLLIASMVEAQGVLEVKDISQPNDVYASENDEAAVIIRCHESIPLTFSSSMDKTAIPFKVELQGTDSIYYIAFPTGNRYRGRVLSIYARGYSEASICLELHPKQLASFQITDPNALVDAGCYREHRNKGVLEIKNSNYEEAKRLFVTARDCSDVDAEENEKNISLADTLIFYRAKAEQAYGLLDYRTASNSYTRVIECNPYDSYAQERKNECIKLFTQDCGTVFSNAEYYFSERDYDKAKVLYEKVIARDCTNNLAIAHDRLNTINTLARAKKDHSRVFTYELMKDMPIGFSYGKYNMHKAGGFFQMDFNTTVFDAIRGDCKYGDKEFPELNIALGWTVKIADPVWIHFGPGFTGKMYYGSYLEDHYPKVGYGETDILDTKEMGTDLTLPKDKIPGGYEDGWEKTNVAVAISPVIGVTAKYSYFALRLSYQYRWSIQSKLKDFMGTSRISVGVGVAF